MRALILAPFAEPELVRLRVAIEVTYESWLDTNRLQDPEQLGARLAAEGIGVLIVEADFEFEEVYDAAPAQRLDGACRNALNPEDHDAATARGIAVIHAPGRNTNAVAEMTLGFMLALLRHIPQAHGMVSGGGWRDPAFGYRLFHGREIAGSTIGVVGFGQIGREVARKCVALGANVLAYDPLVEPATIAAIGAESATLDDLASRSDIITLHVPNSDATQRMIDAAFLARMQPHAYLINTSAGSVIDTPALIDALESGRIAGAALDVFDGQPLPASSPLMSAPNLLLTPHIGGATAETVERHSRMMADEIERMIAGEPLQHCVNPEYALARARAE